jgi:hypothetical protein
MQTEKQWDEGRGKKMVKSY